MLSRLATATGTWLSVRYLRVGQRQYAGVISWVSAIGLALGVAVLIVVISVMNGFDAELKRRILGTVPQVTIDTNGGVSAAVAAAVRSDPRVRAFFPFAEADAMVSRGGAVNPVALYAVDAQARPGLAQIEAAMVSGRLESLFESRRALVLGAPLAVHLGLMVGDSVGVVVPVPAAHGVRPVVESFRLVGTFELKADLDYSLALVNRRAVAPPIAEAFRTGYRLVLDDALAAPAVARELRAVAPSGTVVEDWTSRYGELFQAVRMEKAMMFVLLLLIVAVATFNIVSGQSMLVHDKRGDIAILMTMGASPGFVARVFMLKGVLIALMGIALGLALGAVLAWRVTDVLRVGEAIAGVHLLDGTYFDAIPVDVQALDLVLIAGCSLVLSLVSAYVPARSASRIAPAEALHGAS